MHSKYVGWENHKGYILKQMQLHKQRFSENESLKELYCKWNFYNNFSYIMLWMIQHRKVLNAIIQQKKIELQLVL